MVSGHKKSPYHICIRHGLFSDYRVSLLSQAGLLTRGSFSGCAFPPEIITQAVTLMQPLSPLTALAQRYGFSPYSLFTPFNMNSAPDRGLINFD